MCAIGAHIPHRDTLGVASAALATTLDRSPPADPIERGPPCHSTAARSRGCASTTPPSRRRSWTLAASTVTLAAACRVRCARTSRRRRVPVRGCRRRRVVTVRRAVHEPAPPRRRRTDRWAAVGAASHTSRRLVHVVAPPRSNPCSEPWVRVFRTAALPDDDIVERPDGIRLTSPPRTVVDMTRYVDDVALASVIEHALARRLCTPTTLHRVADRLSSPGRPWLGRFLRILGARTAGAAAESEWERRVFDDLARRGVSGLARQVEIVLPGYGKARFDIAIPELRWALEIDVHPEHRTLEGAARDSDRDDAADEVGWFVRRIAEAQLTLRFERTMDAVVESINRRRRALGEGCAHMSRTSLTAAANTRVGSAGGGRRGGLVGGLGGVRPGSGGPRRGSLR